MISALVDVTSVSTMDAGRRRMDYPQNGVRRCDLGMGAPGVVCGEIGRRGDFPRVGES